MRILPFLAAAIVALPFVPSTARAAHYDVFILAGQSNMDGRAKTAALTGDLAKWNASQPDVRIDYSNSSLRGKALSSQDWMPLAPGFSVAPGSKLKALPGKTFGPEIGFGRTLADAWPGHHIAIIKFAEGGTSLEKDWRVGEKGKLYDQMTMFIEKSFAALKDAGDSFQLRGFVWHQGESDATLKADQYEALLTELIARVRADTKRYAAPGEAPLPVVIGEVFDNHERDSILAAEKEACEKIPNCALASSAGLKTQDAGTHFDAPSQIELGKRMAEAMLPLLTKQ